MELSVGLTNHILGTYASSNPYGIALKGMQRAQATAQKASIDIARGNITPKNVVNLKGAEYAYKANAIVIRTFNEMQGTLLNVLA